MVHSIGEREAWYKVPNRTIITNGGGGLLDNFKGSLSAILHSVYPDFRWDPLKFDKVPQNFWDSLGNQKLFMVALGKKLNIKEGDMEPWYKLSNRVMIDNGGSRLLSRYKSSIYALLCSIFPDYEWDPERFKKVPQKYWISLPNQRALVDEIAKALGLLAPSELSPSESNLTSNSMKWEGWYTVASQTFIDRGGGSLLSQYQGSLPKLLQKVYPEFDWKLWKFPRRTARVRSDSAALNDMFASVEQELGIASPRDWNRISAERLSELGVLNVFNSMEEGLLGALKKRYPNEVWEEGQFVGKGFRRKTVRKKQQEEKEKET